MSQFVDAKLFAYEVRRAVSDQVDLDYERARLNHANGAHDIETTLLMASGKPPDNPELRTEQESEQLDVRALAEELAREAPVDKQRVAELKARIANGTYSSDPAEIGRKLMELESALFAGKTPDEPPTEES